MQGCAVKDKLPIFPPERTHWLADISTLSQFCAACNKFSVPQIEYPLGGSSKKKSSHAYFLLQVFWVILLFYQIVPLI